LLLAAATIIYQTAPRVYLYILLSMPYLFLCILVTASLIFIFKFYQRYNVQTFQAIVVNYLVCIVVGLVMPDNTTFTGLTFSGQPWIPYAMLLGAIFIGTFYLIALATQRVGITATSVATKISLVIPVLFSLLVLKNTLKDYTFLNYLGMVLALVAIVLSSIRPGAGKAADFPAAEDHPKPAFSPFAAILLPAVIFINTGLADSLVNYANFKYLSDADAGIFTMMVFATSATFGLLALAWLIIFRRMRFRFRSIPAGIILGIPNYFSIYFLIKALSAFQNDGAFIYPVNNIGIILTGAIGAVVIFKEKLSGANLAGIGIAVLALCLIAYQEIEKYLF
jgi:drug/metabolite transporter (DMT)-like permease